MSFETEQFELGQISKETFNSCPNSHPLAKYNYRREKNFSVFLKVKLSS